MTSFANLLSKCRSLGKFAGEKMGLKRQRDLVNKAGLGCAAALLELLGHRIAPLNAIGLLPRGQKQFSRF